MTTPAEFLERVLRSIDELAFRLAHTPRDQQEAWLRGFADRVAAQWKEAFKAYMSPSCVDGIVNDVVKRVRKRRDEIESVVAPILH
jgi:hypothetical protein